VVTGALTLDASSSSDNESIVLYEWLNATGGVLATGPVASFPLPPNFASSRDVTLRVTDDEGLTDTETQTIVVRSPIAAFAWRVVSNALRLDGTPSLPGVAAIVLYEWVGTTGAVVATGPSQSISLPPGFSFSGNITLRVTDDHGMIGTRAQAIVVSPPTARFAWRIEGGRLVLDGRTSSDNGTIVRYEWQTGSGAFVAAPALLSLPLPAAGSSANVTLRVTDDGGQTDLETHTVTVPSD
jgi:P pilus assembly chaperone PapD